MNPVDGGVFMEQYKLKVINWRRILGQDPPDDETMRSLCDPQIRPIIERMIRYIRPVEEVQMVRRQVAMWKAKQKFDAAKSEPEDEERAALLRKYKALKTEVQEKAARQLAQKERIESLRREREQKRRKASRLQQEICELKKQTVIVTAVSQQLTAKLSKQLRGGNCVKLYCKNVNQEQQSAPSDASSIVGRFTEEQDNIVKSLTMCSISAPPEQTPDMDLHTGLIELKMHNIALKKQLEQNNSKLEVAVGGLVQCTMHALSDSLNKEMVQEWARLQVTRQTSYVLYNSLQEVISSRSNSLRVDRDYLRLVLIDAEKKLYSLDERYKSVQKELMQSAEDLSHGWQRIEEAAEKARRKHSQLGIESKDAQIRLSELTHKLRSAAAAELKALHDTMTSLIKKDPPLQEVLDFGTTYNDLYYVLKILAQKRTARHGILSLPKMFTPTEDACWDDLFSVNLNQTNDSEKYRKLSSTSEVDQHMDNLLSNNDQLIQSLRDLIAIWWQPPFETAVPEDMVVSGKNILQHTAHWDRVTNFVSKRK